MAKVKSFNFSMGEVSPVWAAKDEVLAGGKALKYAQNVDITADGDISKSGGCLLICADPENADALNSFNFAFNRFNSYFCIILPNAVNNLTKLRIYDNVGNAVSNINLPYSAQAAKQLNFFQANDILFIYCDTYDILALKRISQSNGNFTFSCDTYQISDFMNLRRQQKGLYLYFNNQSGQFKAKASDSLFDSSYLNKKLCAALQYKAFSLSYNISTPSYQSQLFACNSFAGSITAGSQTGTLTIYNRDDYNSGVSSVVKQYSVLPYQSVNFQYVNDEKNHIFYIVYSQPQDVNAVFNLVVDAYVLYAVFTIITVENSYNAVIGGLNYNNDFYKSLFEGYAPQIVDLALPNLSNGYVEQSGFSSSELNNNIFGREDSANGIQWLGLATSYSFSVKYNFNTPSVVKRFRAKGEVGGMNAPVYSLIIGVRLSANGQIIAQQESVYTTSGGDNTRSVVFDFIALFENNTAAANYVELYYYPLNSTPSGVPVNILYTYKIQGISPSDTYSAKETYSYRWGADSIKSASTGAIFQNRHFIADTSIVGSGLAAFDNFNNLIQNQISDDAPFMLSQNTFKYGKILQLVPFKQGILALTTDQEIFILFDDGKMIKLYADLLNNTIAFSRVEISGKISAVCVVDDQDDKYLWAVVDDKIVKFLHNKQEFACYLHFADVYDGNINSVSAPDLEGVRYVQCYDADANMWIEKINEPAGDIHLLAKTAKRAYAGVSYLSKFETLDFVGQDAQYSTKKDRIDTVYAYLVNSAGLRFSGQQLQDEISDDGYIKLFNGKYNKIRLMRSKYEYEKTVVVESDKPYPFTIASLTFNQGGDA